VLSASLAHLDFGHGFYGFCQQLAAGVLSASLAHLLKPEIRNIEEWIDGLFGQKKRWCHT
jgi:hypothetical protein